MFENSGVLASQKRIKSGLEYSLDKKYGIKDSTIATKILDIHGLAKHNLDFVANFENLIEKGLADASFDQNANKANSTITSLGNEIAIPINKIIGYRFLYRKLRDMYGKKEAKRLAAEMYDLSIALSDSSNILKPYCWSFDASKIVLEGRPFGQLQSKPPKRVVSYISALNETVHQMSNSLAGAIAVGTFFMDIAHILIYREEVTLKDYTNSDKLKKYITNNFQNFVHSVNHLSRSSNESPFTNLSIFDRPKLASLLGPDNLEWYFKGQVNGQDISIDYVIDYILELQENFMDFFDKGDPLKDGAPYRFPVVTANISKLVEKKTILTMEDGSKKEGLSVDHISITVGNEETLVKLKDLENEDIKKSALVGQKHISKVESTENISIPDQDFLESFTQNRDVFRYNVMTSEGTKVSSCCRLSSIPEMLELGNQVNSFGGTAISLGSHRVATLNLNRLALESESEEDFYARLAERTVDATKILISHRELIKDILKKNPDVFFEAGWITMSKMFSTIGLSGYYEMNENLQEKFNTDTDYVFEALKIINKIATEKSIELNNAFNIEQIPAESMAAKLAKVDRLLYGNKLVPQSLYANQFVPQDVESSIWKRMDVTGKYDKLLTGGGITSVNLSEIARPEVYKKIINYSIKSGAEFFALNAVYSTCMSGHTTIGNNKICPICSSKVVEQMSRTVGFMTPISSWNDARRELFERWDFEDVNKS